MSTLTYATRDSVTMLRRNLLHILRYPSMTLMLIGQPVLFLVLFVYVFGGTMGAGLPGGTGRQDYLTYIAPAVLIITVASVALSTAISVPAPASTASGPSAFIARPPCRISPTPAPTSAALNGASSDT